MQKFKEVHLGLRAFIRTKNSFTFSIIFSVVLFTLLCLIQNGSVSFQVFSFSTIPFLSKIALFFETLFNVSTYFTSTTLSIAIISSILSGVSLAIAYEYFLIRKQVIDAGSVAITSLAYVLVIVGIQCAACSLILVSLLVSLLGTFVAPSLYMSLSVWVGVVGILVQIVVLWVLLGKLSKPLIC